MCEYCENIINESDYTGWEDNLIIKTKDGKFDLRIFTGCDNAVIENIKFCPICGRNLTEEENKEEIKPIIHAHAIIDWIGDCKCSNCKSTIDITEPYCQHCGAILDEPEERED